MPTHMGRPRSQPDRPKTWREIMGDRLADMRKLAGMTQLALDEKAEVGKGKVSEVECGGGNPTLETLEKIARALGLSEDDFFFYLSGRTDASARARETEEPSHEARLKKVENELVRVTSILDSLRISNEGLEGAIGRKERRQAERRKADRRQAAERELAESGKGDGL